MKIKELHKMKHSYLTILFIIVFSLIANCIISQTEVNYLGINGLKVKNSIAYFEFSTVIKSEKTCLAKLEWDDRAFENKRNEEYNQILHPTTRFDRNYYVWSYNFAPCTYNHEDGSSRKCDTPRTSSNMILRYINKSPVSVGQYMFGREGLRDINISCSGSYIYSTSDVLTMRFSKVNVELVSVKRGMEDKWAGSLFELVTLVEGLSEIERVENSAYDLLVKISDAASFSFETLKAMHITAVNLDGL